MPGVPHNFTLLVWEFVNNQAAGKKYRLSDPDKPGPVPAPLKAPKVHSKQDKALRGNSAKAVNAEIKKDWPAAAVAPPLIKPIPPNWPSRP